MRCEPWPSFWGARTPTVDDQRAVTVAATDRPALLAGWIGELLFLAESEGFVATRLVDLDLQTARLTATVAGLLAEPPPLVKAAT